MSVIGVAKRSRRLARVVGQHRPQRVGEPIEGGRFFAVFGEQLAGEPVQVVVLLIAPAGAAAVDAEQATRGEFAQNADDADRRDRAT